MEEHVDFVLGLDLLIRGILDHLLCEYCFLVILSDHVMDFDCMEKLIEHRLEPRGETLIWVKITRSNGFSKLSTRVYIVKMDILLILACMK